MGNRIADQRSLYSERGAYYWDGEDAWLKVYQIKMKAEKMIPISLVLYRIMKIYIKKHHIKTTEFLFKAQDGGAYRTGTFLSGFRSNCKKYGVCLSEINLKPMITGIPWQAALYDNGVSIQTIRDYLGHNNENMTKQYIDYVPKRIEQANTDILDSLVTPLQLGLYRKREVRKLENKIHIYELDCYINATEEQKSKCGFEKNVTLIKMDYHRKR